MNLNKELCQLFRTKRLKWGYSQEFVANKIGVVQSVFQKIESGKTNVKFDQVFKICEILDIKVEELPIINKLKSNLISETVSKKPPLIIEQPSSFAEVNLHLNRIIDLLNMQVNGLKDIISVKDKYIEHLEGKIMRRDKKIEYYKAEVQDRRGVESI